MSDCISVKPTDDEIFTDNAVDFGDVVFESDDEDNENAISVEKLKNEVMGGLEPELNFDRGTLSTHLITLYYYYFLKNPQLHLLEQRHLKFFYSHLLCLHQLPNI